MKHLRKMRIDAGNETFKPFDQAVRVGDEIVFEMTDGETVEAIAIRQEKNGILFIQRDCLQQEEALQRRGDYPGWEECDLRKKLNKEILERYPEEIRKAMQPLENGDLLRIPTEKEIFGENEYGLEEPETVEQFEIMRDRRNRIAFQGHGGDPEWYWLQNRLRGVYSATWAAIVYGTGHAYRWNASAVLGVRPLFILNL